MPAPLAPYFVLGVLAGQGSSAVLVEPTHDAGLRALGPENPLLACCYWIGKSEAGTCLAPTSPGGGGGHPLPAPATVRELPRWYRAACYSAGGKGEERWGALGLTVSGGWGP